MKSPETSHGDVLTCLFHYSYSVILLYRPASTGNDAVSNFWGDRPKAVAAANEITRVMEDVLSTSFVRLSQIHTLVSLYPLHSF